MSPLSSRTCSSSSCSLTGASSVYCSCATLLMVFKMNLNPSMGAKSRSSMRNKMAPIVPRLARGAALQLEADVHEIIGRPGARVLEVQAVAVLAGNAVDRLIELGFALALD